MAVVLNPANVQGQTAADLFNPDVVQEIRLSINSRDLRDLHERSQENTNLDFVDRSRAASQLAPGRDLGVMVHGRLLDRSLTYEAGIFNHDGRNARTSDSDRVSGGRTLAARVTFQPFRGEQSSKSDLQIGAAFNASPLEEGFSDLRGRTALDLRFYRPGVWVDGNRHRLGTELRWRPGPSPGRPSTCA